MKFYTISLFPKTLEDYSNESILGRAQKNKLISIKNIYLRDFSRDKHKRTDGPAYGGGPGMVMFPDPIIQAFQKILKEILRNKETPKKILIINFVPSAKVFTNTLAKEYSKKYNYIIFICGRYEGVDGRVNLILKDILSEKKEKPLRPKLNFKIENISIGDFVLTGGELPALVLIDAISRQIAGVLHDKNSLEENRIASSLVYSRPEIYERKNKKYPVPKVLLSGHHKDIAAWRASSH